MKDARPVIDLPHIDFVRGRLKARTGSLYNNMPMLSAINTPSEEFHKGLIRGCQLQRLLHSFVSGHIHVRTAVALELQPAVRLIANYCLQDVVFFEDTEGTYWMTSLPNRQLRYEDAVQASKAKDLIPEWLLAVARRKVAAEDAEATADDDDVPDADGFPELENDTPQTPGEEP